jgi:hypothetical protein
MSYKANETQQVGLNDRFNNLTEKEKKVVLGSWAKPFADIIFPSIHEDDFAVLYSGNKATRPNTPVNIVVGAMIIKEIVGMTDNEVLESLSCDIRMQYALHTTSYAEQPMSDRTFSRFRQRLYEYEQETGEDLMKEELLSQADKIAKFMELQPYLKRMDSLMIASACKDMTRLEVIYVTVANLANAVHRIGADELLQGMEHYLNPDDQNRTIYHNQAEDRVNKMQAMVEDCAALLERLGEGGAELPEYTLAVRMLDDQSAIGEDGKRAAKNSHDIEPGSMQDPSDPEATYRKKAGKGYKGYVANLVQTYDEKGSAVITGYDFQPNSYSDVDFGKEAIETIAEAVHVGDTAKTELIADGGFASGENSALAKENGISFIATSLTGTKPPEILADFVIDSEEHRIEQCPMGNQPQRQSWNPLKDTYRATMEKDQCANCPHRAECKAQITKYHAFVTISANIVERAKAVKEISSDAYSKYRNSRNAVEGLPSVLRRRYAVDAMPVFGIMKSKLFFGFKIAAINVKNLLKYTRGHCVPQNATSLPREQYAQI